MTADFDPYDHVQDMMKDEAVFAHDLEHRLSAIAQYPAWKQDTFLVLSSEGLISNGGTPGLFYNDGCIIPRSIVAYETIGAPEHAAWLHKLAALLGDPYPLDIEVINELITEIPDEVWEEPSRFFHDNQNWFKIQKLVEIHQSTANG